MIPDSVPYGLPSDSLAQRIGLPVWQRRQWNSGHLRTPRRRPSTRRSVESAESADRIGNRVLIPDPVHTMPPDPGLSTTTTAQEPQNTNNRPALGRQSTEAPVIRRPVPTDQIGDRVLISRSVQTTPSSTKPPIHYNNTKTAEYQQPTSTADISHRADAV